MKKIKYKGRTLTRTVVKNNILRIFDMAAPADKYDWYRVAHNHTALAADKWGIPRSCAVGVLAALSPRKTWDINIELMNDFLKRGDCGQIKLFVEKAKQIVASDGSDEAIMNILNGRKIQAFYMNIMYPDAVEYVTIDRHALSVAFNEWIDEEFYAGMTSRQYEFFVQCYIFAALRAGVSPLLMQSATWVVWRRVKRDYR